MLLRSFRSFQTQDSGAITVDWVVLAAGIVGLGIAAASAMQTSAAANSASPDLSLSRTTVAPLTAPATRP